MAKASEKIIEKANNFFDLERSYIIFAIIFFPVAILFYDQGAIEKTILAIYITLMTMVGMLLITRFVLFLSKSSDEKAGNYGSVLTMYFFDVFIPLVMAKVMGYTVIRMLPASHYGLLCDLKSFIKDLYYIFDYQNTLDLIIATSLVVFVGLAVWSVGRKAK